MDVALSLGGISLSKFSGRGTFGFLAFFLPLTENDSNPAQLCHPMGKAIAGGSNKHVVLGNIQAPGKEFYQLGAKDALNRQEINSKIRVNMINLLQVFR